MRTAFITLLFANLAFMGWAVWVDTPKQVRTNETSSRLPQLKLVGELPPDQQQGGEAAAVQKVAMTTPTGDSAATPPVLADPVRCVSVGPFSDLEIAAKAAGALHARGFTPVQRAEEGEALDEFWVYIGGVADSSAADKVFKALDRNGIKDAHLMPESSDGRRISVGLFSERDRAERRVKSIEKLGFKADVEERKQPGAAYWVDLNLKPSDGAVPVQDLLFTGAGSSRLSVQACPTKTGTQPAAAPAAAPGAPTEPRPAGARVPRTTVAGTPTLPSAR